jgi:ABC-type transporter Mla subunit MlaD
MSKILEAFGLDGFLSYVFFVLIFGLFIFAIRGLVQRFNQIRKDSEVIINAQASIVPDSGTTYDQPYSDYKNQFVENRSMVSFGDFVDVNEIAPATFPTPKLSTSIPSILTILGILGTFIVLVISLKGLDAKSADMNGQITKLLTGTKTAYFKSVWGVACSLLYTFTERWLSDLSQRNVDKVVRKVDGWFPVLTQEEVSKQSLGAIELVSSTIVNAQTAMIDESKSSSALMTKTLNEVKQATVDLAAKFNGFEETMTNVAKKGAESQNEAIRELLKDVVEEFRDQMVNGVKDGLQQLTTAMDASSERLNTFSRTTSEVSDKLNTTVDKLVDIHGELNRNIDGINESLESVSETMDAAKETTDRCLAILKEMADGTEVNQEAIQQLYMTVKKLEPTIAAVLQCQTRSEENVEKMAQTVRELDESLSGFSQKLGADLGSFIGEFSGAADTLTGAGQDFANQVSDHVQKYCSDLDNSLASAVTSLKNGVTEIQDGVVPSAETLTRTVGSISQTMTQLNDALTRLQPSGDKIKQLAELMSLLKAMDLPKDETSK